MVLIWPLLSLPAGVFTKDYFSFWVFVSIAWSFVATICIISLPIYESMDAIIGIMYYLAGKPQPSKTEKELDASALPAEGAGQAAEVPAKSEAEI